MTRRVSQVVPLLATGLRGLRSRLLLTVGSVILAAISVGAAVVGPMYQTGAASSYLVTKLRTEPNVLTGVVFDYGPSTSPDERYPAALGSARRLADQTLNDQFAGASTALWTTRLGALGGLGRVVSEAGACQHVNIVGRCPVKAGEALILKHDSAYAHVKIGQRIRLAGIAGSLKVVGTYTPRAADEDFWFNPIDLESLPPAPGGSNAPPQPYKPAPFIVAPQTFARFNAGTWYVRATRRLDVTPTMSVADLQSAVRAVGKVNQGPKVAGVGTLVPGTIAAEPGNELKSVGQEVQQRHATARSTVAPAVVSVVLVALVLLLRLLSAAMDLRRPELALASLRGYSRRQMWLLGLMEPALMLAIATPIGIVVGFLGAQALARKWLVAGLPMPLSLSSLLATLAVVVITFVVAAFVVRDAVNEPLSAQIAGVRRPGRSGRWAALLQIVLIALAVAALVATIASGRKSSPDATDLALPILLAAAAGLITTFAAQAAARRWATWTGKRRGVFAYLASRTISRRREGTLVILPLTAALAISVFAAGVYTAAADWRGSYAATIVGAERSYSTELTMDQAVATTHQIDPKGRWLMAVGAEYTTDGERVIMDTPRLARVGVWPRSWTPGLSASDISHDLSTRRPSVVLTGKRLSLTIDNQVTGDSKDLGVDLTIINSNGKQVDVLPQPFAPGVSTRTIRLDSCETGCLVRQVSFGGPAAVPEVMDGRATVTGFTVDGKPVPAALDLPWRTSQPLLKTPEAVAGQPKVAGGKLVVDFHSTTAVSFASITPNDVPLVRPVVVGRTAHLTVVKRLPGGDLDLHTDSFIPLDVHPMATADSMPVTGPTGMLIDYTMLSRDVTITNSATFVTILARGDTPPSVTAALGGLGITRYQTLSSARNLLDQDAFALALNLYLVVTFIVILLALAGLGANLAVQMPARRRDAASLRVVGLRRRSIIAAVIAEFFVVLGAAAVAGVLAGSVAQYVVVRTVTLGYADTEHTPRLVPSLNVASVTGLLVVIAVGLFAVAVTIAALTVRGARTASLRESAR